MKCFALLFSALVLTATTLTAQTNPPASREQFMALPMGQSHGPVYTINASIREGIPFHSEGALPLEEGGSAQVNVGGTVDHIFLLGMTDKNPPKAQNRRGPGELIRPEIPMDAWTDPHDESVRFWVGDIMGEIRLSYADGTTEVYPLHLGESIWWGRVFYDYQEPFNTDAILRNAFKAAIRLYPPWPLEDGNYVAVIKTKRVPLQSITFENNPAKKGTLAINGITVETTDTNGIGGFPFISAGPMSPNLAKFVEEKPLLPLGEDVHQSERRLQDLRLALYSSDATFKGSVAPEIPAGYSGPMVSFKGNLVAEVMANAFYNNVQDILNKIDDGGMYHTSTSNALSWGGYKGFGTFRNNFGRYFSVAYSRDMGRSLQEITMLGFTNDALRVADWALGTAHRWTTEPRLKIDGLVVPPHWSMFVDRPDGNSYENDGQGLMTMFIYKTWQRLPDRDDWLRSHWPDVQGLGDWILWQFDHPEISQATNGLLRTRSESAGGSGYSVYPDCICMYSLRALAQMADSIGETNSAGQWRDRADKMQKAITDGYIINDPEYGRVWTLEHAGWPNKSTVLGPLIFVADYEGFAPRDEKDDWRPVNEAAYRRLVVSYPPFGFYGQAMGYGQGFVTQSALLLDRMRDATTMLDWAAKEIYDPRFNQFDHYIVPEGVQITPDARYWYRIGDLGNGVQEAEIVKALRLVIGVDDTRPDRLQFYPRMPYGWNEMAVDKYPLIFEKDGNIEKAFLRYKLRRAGHGMKLEISADKNLGRIPTRLGPFEKQPETSDVKVNGKTLADALIEHSGDSWWIKFDMPVGPAASK